MKIEILCETNVLVVRPVELPAKFPRGGPLAMPRNVHEGAVLYSSTRKVKQLIFPAGMGMCAAHAFPSVHEAHLFRSKIIEWFRNTNPDWQKSQHGVWTVLS